MRRLRYGQIQPCHRTREEAVAGAHRLTVRRSGLRPDAIALVLGGLNGQSLARRIAAAATAIAAGTVGSLGTPGASALLPN